MDTTTRKQIMKYMMTKRNNDTFTLKEIFQNWNINMDIELNELINRCEFYGLEMCFCTESPQIYRITIAYKCAVHRLSEDITKKLIKCIKESDEYINKIGYSKDLSDFVRNSYEVYMEAIDARVEFWSELDELIRTIINNTHPTDEVICAPAFYKQILVDEYLLDTLGEKCSICHTHLHTR